MFIPFGPNPGKDVILAPDGVSKKVTINGTHGGWGMWHTKKVTITGTLGDGDVAHQEGYYNWNTWGWGCGTPRRLQ